MPDDENEKDDSGDREVKDPLAQTDAESPRTPWATPTPEESKED
jgi:hypothetical protein